MSSGWVAPDRPVLNLVTFPFGVIRPIAGVRAGTFCVNQRLTSGPAAMSPALPCCGF
jgi:hypothetical protein